MCETAARELGNVQCRHGTVSSSGDTHVTILYYQSGSVSLQPHCILYLGRLGVTDPMTTGRYCIVPHRHTARAGLSQNVSFRQRLFKLLFGISGGFLPFSNLTTLRFPSSSYNMLRFSAGLSPYPVCYVRTTQQVPRRHLVRFFFQPIFFPFGLSYHSLAVGELAD